MREKKQEEKVAGRQRQKEMLFPFPLSITNYRSLREKVEIPFSRKITFLVGPNNSGKSNILRFLGILFNNSFGRIDDYQDFDGKNKQISITVKISSDHLLHILKNRPNAKKILRDSGTQEITFDLIAGRQGLVFDKGNGEFEKIFQPYISNDSRHFLDDFHQTSSSNREFFLKSLEIDKLFKGTTFLPNMRFITHADQEPPQFVNWKMPGETLAFGSVIKRLALMDRPDPESRFLRDHKKQIEDFMAHCLEKKAIRLEVPESKKTILVDIDGDERPIGSFGTGVEQLLMIGLASIGFPEKLVLIDEPEMNLHPRAQKRIINYLDQVVDAQFVIATHSAAVLDAAEADIIQVTNSGGTTKSRTLLRNKDRYEAVRDLGHSPSELVQTKFAIWVEGPSDRIYLLHWLHMIEPSLVEGIDFTILFYGGKVLSHHSFVDESSDLVKAVSLSRAFAVIMDSDRTRERPNLNRTKSRVKSEIEREGGYCWITEGREIENYVPDDVIRAIQQELPGVSVPAEKRDQVLDPNKANKVDFARAAALRRSRDWPLDLKSRVNDLVDAIRRAQ